jgi:beta-lactamase class D
VEEVHYFGLTFNIEKSAFCQVDFLKSLCLNDFKLSDKTMNIVRSALKVKETGSYKLYAKTGMGPIKSDTGIAWYIGFVERGDNTYFFAANVVNDDELLCKKLVIDFSLRTLKSLKLIE